MGYLAAWPRRFCKILQYKVNSPLEQVLRLSRMKRAPPYNKLTLYSMLYCSALHSGRLSLIVSPQVACFACSVLKMTKPDSYSFLSSLPSPFLFLDQQSQSRTFFCGCSSILSYWPREVNCSLSILNRHRLYSSNQATAGPLNSLKLGIPNIYGF